MLTVPTELSAKLSLHVYLKGFALFVFGVPNLELNLVPTLLSSLELNFVSNCYLLYLSLLYFFHECGRIDPLAFCGRTEQPLKTYNINILYQ